MSSPITRPIPDHVSPVVEQGLMNLISAGYRIISPDGVDITASYVSKTGVIVGNYDRWLNKDRRKRCITRN